MTIDIKDLEKEASKTMRYHMVREGFPAGLIVYSDEIKIVHLLALQALGAKIDPLLEEVKKELIRNYTSAEIARGTESAAVMVGRFVDGVNAIIERQLGPRR